MLGDFLYPLEVVGVDAEELHPARRVSLRQLLHDGDIAVGKRAGGPCEDEDDGLLIRVVGERVLLALDVSKLEVFDLTADGGLAAVCLRCGSERCPERADTYGGANDDEYRGQAGYAEPHAAASG